ncbi:hypothetical protein [Mucilaginibacter sp. AK015]|uniref:hypothetical protein n=1 Tax=Mucilaginibacter sp. AK015 TaxID=2723072 RepID=UPI0016187132|nr:hypothetical protein [Mucilaginibacter sp. AK015]MBB5397179.1 hypothetical protein [Mucilaginibacter sp. AK015]
MATQATVHNHAYQHFEDLQLSADQFYTMLEAMIKEYQYPDITISRRKLKEGGLLSANRAYLCISRDYQHYYVCAAPYGRSFFISWWLQEDAHTASNVAEKIPLFGKAIAERMESKSYYQLDTELMFIQSISAIIRMAVEKVKADHGHRSKDNTAS